MMRNADDDEWQDQTFEPDIIVEAMKRNGLPITRQSYIDFNWPDGVPTMSPGELDVPRWLRDDEVLH